MGPPTPLIRPEEYFDDRDDPLVAGSLVFVVYTVVSIALFYAVLRTLIGQVENPPDGFEDAVMSAFGSTSAGIVIGLLLSWVVVAVIMHFGTIDAAEDSTFSDAFAVAGWAYAPEVVTAPISFLLSWREATRHSFDGSDPDELAVQLQAVEAGLSIPEIALFAMVTLWSVYILAKGVSVTHETPIEEAAVPAVIVGTGSFVLTLLL